MGGFSNQPYIYPSPCGPRNERQLAFPSQSEFNPRAATQAAYQNAYYQSQPRPRPGQNGPLIQFDQPVNSYMVLSGDGKASYTPAAFEELQKKKRISAEKKNGPLVNFNQHPDSWMVVTSPTPTYTPMPKSTKTKVKVLRWIQFCLRVLEEVGALGLLVCMIVFTNMPTAFSWVMRIAPAWDVVVSLYAIYHLIRSATARTATSSASYHIFALVNDIGLIPFYAYLCIYARNNYEEDPNAKSRWDSLFKNEDTTTGLLLTTFLGTATVAGLHLASAVLDMWLIILFKQIAKLPPDVNPLEDNLTRLASHRRSKHKYKNSEATLTDTSLTSEKSKGFLSGSTLSVDEASQLGKDIDEADSRRIPFNHTRVQSALTASPNKLASNRLSREDLEDIRLSEQRQSKPSTPTQAFDSKLRNHAVSSSPKEVIPWPPSFRERASPSPRKASASRASDWTAITPPLPNAAPSSRAVERQQKSKLLNDNWYSVTDDDASSYGGISRAASRAKTPNIVYTDAEPIPENAQMEYAVQPLGMNPPTPPPPTNTAQIEQDEVVRLWQSEDGKLGTVKRKPLGLREDGGNGDGGIERNLTVKSVITTTSSVYSTSDIDHEEDEDVPPVPQLQQDQNQPFTTFAVGSSVAAPKGKYYGDLASATRGVLGTQKSKGRPTTEVSRIMSSDTAKSNGTIGASMMDSTGLSALGSFGYGLLPKRSTKKKDRVISRTGVDIVDYAEGEDGSGLRGRRDVSGKIAEEGRGGTWWSRRG